jgi:hypothetical protein
VKRGVGVFALLVALVAGARFGVTPPSSKTNNSTGIVSEAAPVSLEVAGPNCSAFSDAGAAGAGEITTLVDQYLHGIGEQETPDVAAPLRTLPTGIEFVIATVPDPLHTHLNLLFDRTIEAIQQAAQDEKYTYDSSWLPWKQRAAAYSGRDDEIKERNDIARRERCPGLILFRKSIGRSSQQMYDDTYNEGLFLFLVGEKPTTGIDRMQWNNALMWIERHADHSSPEKTLRVLGPTFSGSVPSMARAVIDAGRQKPKNSFADVLLYTGTIRGCSAYEWLNEELQKSSPLPLRTADFDENDAVQIDRYFKYLTDRGHSLSEIAILSEDETAYGGLPDNHPQPETGSCDPAYAVTNRPLHLYYPRDISALRSAYEEQSIFASSDSANSTHLVLQPQIMQSTHQDTDTIPTFSGSNLALAQEAQMYGVVDSLRTHGIRFVILRSTSTLDYLFLTRFLHRAYADAFIVTMGPDILFGREIDSTEFRGVVALTAFPLLPRGQDWTAGTGNNPRHAHRVFASDSMEGAYLATRFVITDPMTTNGETRPYIHPFKLGIPDYAPPHWATARPNDPATGVAPSTWLSVVGRGGYWPLAVLTEPFSKSAPLRSNLAIIQSSIELNSSNRPFNPSLPVSLSPAWKICCELAVLATLLHFFACCYGWKYQNLSMLIQFTPAPGIRQLSVISFGWVVLVCALILMFLCSARINPYLHFSDSAWILSLALVALLGCLGIARDIDLRFSGEPRSIRRRTRPAIVWIIFPFLLVACALWAGLSAFYAADTNAVPTAYRAIHLSSGVSPMVTLLIMLSGFYWWFWQTLSGLALLGQGRPVLPRRAALPPALARISDAMARNIESFAIPLPGARIGNGIFYLLPLTLLVLQFWILRRSSSDGLDLMLHSLENVSFDRTLQVIFAIAFFLIVLECAQLLSTWLSLKRLLLALNRTPLRRTFFALQGLSMRSLWSMSGTSSRARYTIFSHQLESLHHLHNVIRSFDARDPKDVNIRKTIDDTWTQGREFVEQVSRTVDLAMINDPRSRRMRKIFRECTGQIFSQLLFPNWFEEKNSLDLAENAEKAASYEVLPLSEDEVTRHAEEFVCLTYVAFLQNLMGRMRTMVLSILGLFAALAFSLAFYPYTPRPAIVLSLLFLLLVVGSVVAVVYAGLSRDATISHITNTETGELGTDFWIRLGSFIGVPLIGLLAAQFPGITDFLVSWIEPGLNAVK